MGLRGPVSKPPRLRAIDGNPGRRKATSRDVPAALRARIDRTGQLMLMGDYYGARVVEAMAAGDPAPKPALWAALKCWRAAQDAVYRTVGFEDEPATRDPIQVFQQARPPRPA